MKKSDPVALGRSGLNGINTRDCWVDEAALAAALAETRPAPLASLPGAKRLATFLVNAAKVAADMQKPRYADLLRRKAIVHPAYVVPPYAPHYVPPPPTTPPPLFETGLKPEV